MELNLEKVFDKMKKLKENLNPDDSFFVDKEFCLENAMKALIEANDRINEYKKIKTDLVKKGRKAFTYKGLVCIVEWTNHYEKRYVEVDFLYPMVFEKDKHKYIADADLESYAMKIIEQ